MIGPIAAVENFVLKAFNFSGRATRAEYWFVFLFLTILFLITLVWDGFTLVMSSSPSINPLAYATPVLFLLTLIPNMSLTIRRLHDSGRSGFAWMVVFVPFVGVPWFGALMGAKSEPEDNQYGPMVSAGPKRGRKASGGKGKDEKRDPWQSYAVLLNAENGPSPEMVAAQREQIAQYYREKVLSARPAE